MKEMSYRAFSKRRHKQNMKAHSPNLCQFELTFGCAFHCRHCYTDCYNNRGTLRAELGTDAVKKVLDEIHRTGVLWLSFTGGDPFTRKDFLEIYSYAKAKGFLVTLFTNCYSLSAQILSYLKKYPPFSIEVTMNAVEERLHDFISQAPGTFARTRAHILALRRSGLPVKIKTQVTKDNIGHIAAIRQFLDSIDLEFHPVLQLHARLNGDTSPCRLRLSKEEILTFFRQNGGMDRKGGGCELLVRHQGPGRRPPAKERLFQCAVLGGDGIYIDPYGELLLCPLMRGCKVPVSGTSLRGGLATLLPLMRESVFRTRSRCKRCAKRRACFWCPGKAYVETGDREAPISYYCQLAANSV